MITTTQSQTDQDADRIAEAYGRIERFIASTSGPAWESMGWIGMEMLREESGLSQPAFEEAIKCLSRRPGWCLAPTSNQKVLTDAQHEAAVWIGGQWKHMIIYTGA